MNTEPEPGDAERAGKTFELKAVLLVDDDKQLASALQWILADENFLVDVAFDGEEALLKVAAHDYDVVICDLKMPKIDGMQFYQRLSVEYPDSARRVIFVTGDVAGTDAERFLQESGCRWLAKPFRLGDLLRTAREILV